MSLCAHMGCSTPAEVGVLHDPRSRTVWLVEIPGDDQMMTAMCLRHADRLVVPRGWEVADLRDGHPRLWVLDTSTPEAARNRPRRGSRRRVNPSGSSPSHATLWSGGEPGDPSDHSSEESPDRRSSSDWVGDPAERHSSLLETSEDTPLLARAFRASRAS